MRINDERKTSGRKTPCVFLSSFGHGSSIRRSELGVSMSRFLIASLVVIVVAIPASADRMAPIARPVERALRTPVVVVGKVTAIEKDPVDATLYPGAQQKVSFKIAVVKVETNLAGA